jgi:hypothetical protein
MDFSGKKVLDWRCSGCDALSRRESVNNLDRSFMGAMLVDRGLPSGFLLKVYIFRYMSLA